MLGLIVVATEDRPGLSAAELFEPLLGAPLLARAIAGALPADQAVTGVLVVPADLVERAQVELIDRFGLDEIDRVVAGGPNRADAIAAGLKALPDDVEWVILQEGARVLTPSGLVDRVIEAAQNADAAAPAVRLRGPVIADEDGSVTPLEIRPRLRELQGPQVFKAEILRHIFEGQVGKSDPAEAAALAGASVVLVDGDDDNLLLQGPADVSRALEVFSRRAVDYAFLYPKDLLPDDPLKAALDPGEPVGEMEVGTARGEEDPSSDAEGNGSALDADETQSFAAAPGPDEVETSNA